MGSSAQDMKDLKKKGSSGKRGSVNNASRLAGLQPIREAAGTATWEGAQPGWIAAVVIAATVRGYIISFQLSRDSGAHGLSLYGEGENVRLWFNGDADLDVELEKIFVYLQAMQ